jgi:hypothetical protein
MRAKLIVSGYAGSAGQLGLPLLDAATKRAVSSPIFAPANAKTTEDGWNRMVGWFNKYKVPG